MWLESRQKVNTWSCIVYGYLNPTLTILQAYRQDDNLLMQPVHGTIVSFSKQLVHMVYCSLNVLKNYSVLARFLSCALMRSRVMHLVMSVCVRICIYDRKSTAKYNELLALYKFKCLQSGLLHPVSCKDRVIHAFPNKTWRSPWPRNIFFWALTAHHTL